MALFSEKDFTKKLNTIIKIGEVSSVNYAKATARVVFDDDDSVVSYDLQVLHTNAYKNKDYALPDIGEDVICLFLPSGTEEGFILGSVYAGDITPPENNRDKRTILFSDGTRIVYNRQSHELSVTIEGTTIVADRQKIEIETPLSVDVTTGQTATVTAGQSATVKAPVITLDGNVVVTGTVTASGDVTGAGISLQNHLHTGNMGLPTSAPIP